MTILQLDPRQPLVWRSPASLQLGGRTPVAVVEDVTAAEERMLAALRRGVPATTLAAHGRCTPAEASALLERVAPALATATATPALAITIRVRDAQSRRIGEEARSLGLLGPAGGTAAGEAVPAGIVIGTHAIPPAAYRDWLRHDVPHIGIVLGVDEVLVSHVVIPGRSACLRCADLRRRDADPCWPAVAAQLVARPAAAAEDPVLRLAAVTTAVRRLRAALVTGEPVDGLGDGELRVESTAAIPAPPTLPHEECGCRLDEQPPA